MRRLLVGLTMAGLVAVVGLSGCSDQRGPRPGDTVTPQLSPPVQWKAGEAGQLGVRLQAQGKDAAAPRPLDFAGISSNPVANITFFEDEQPLNSVEVALSHRC